MKTNLTIIILFFASTFSLFGQQHLGSLKICGLDKETKTPLLDTFIVSQGNGPGYRLQPDAEGCVLVKDIPVGKYEVTLRVSNYEAMQYQDIYVGEARTCYLSYELKPLAGSKSKKKKHGDK